MGKIKTPVRYNKHHKELFDADNVSIATFQIYAHQRAEHQANQIADAFNATAREARLVEALELFADPDNWGQQQFESYDGDGIERVGFRYTFNDGDVDSDPITIAAEALAEYRGEK